VSTFSPRVDLDAIRDEAADDEIRSKLTEEQPPQFRWTVIPVSVLLCVAQALTILATGNLRSDVMLSSTLIPVVGFAVIAMLVPLNALLARVFRHKLFHPLTRVELTAIFAALLVTSGIATSGLTEQLVPIMPTPFNPEWNTPQRGWEEEVVPHLNRTLYIQDEETIRRYREGITHTLDGSPIARPADQAPLSKRLHYYREILLNIGWSHWLPPLGRWLVFVGGWYLIFYSLTYIVLQYWVNREKTLFPLARLSEAMLPEADEKPGSIPSLFRSSLFWWGFALSFGVISFNSSVLAGFLPGFGDIPLGMSAGSFDQVVKGTLFQGLGGEPSYYALSFHILFTAIGIAFLLSLEVSHSSWLYWLLGQCLLLVMVWMGFGWDSRDFPSDWLWQNNPLSAMGGGGILLFGAVSLTKCLKDYAQITRGRGTREKIRVGMPVIFFVLGVFIVVAWLQWNRLPWIWGLLFVGILTLITLGLMRIVAESGIYWFQAHVGFFHLYKVFGLGVLLNPSLILPLLPMTWILFANYNTFMAPNLLNAAKMNEDASGNRRRFHCTLIASIIVSVVVAIGFALFLAHLVGASHMGSGGWFYTYGPQSLFDKAVRAAGETPAFHATTATWYILGAGWIGLSMMVRRKFFRFPHPIGFLMLVNPVMGVLWFSFFIGWFCKKVVVTYGGKATFDTARAFFIGLILGELIAVFVWPMLSIAFDFPLQGVDLQRSP